MATKEVKKPETPISLKPSPMPKDHDSQSATSRPKQNDASSRSKVPLSTKQFIVSVAANISSQPLPTYDPNVWGVLTAISKNARKRPQGMNMLLTADEHSIGRLVEDVSFRIESISVSAEHCKIYRKRVTNEDTEQSSNSYPSVFLKDMSTNGTYLNWERFRKNSPELKIQHGDIISFSAPPQHELAFAFVYREVLRFAPSVKGACAKRKAEELACENKRLKGIGIGAPEGPLSLDDFRSLQRSNRELRRQLEDQVLTIDTLRNENRATVERHENAIKEIKESVANSYLDQLQELNNLLDVKQKELVEVNRISAEQKHAIEDLNLRLTASIQSCTEANEIMKSQKASIAELKVQFDEERDQRREEREKAAVDLKAAVQRAQSEAQEELQRLSDVALKREKEQQEVINKLEESLRKSSSQVEGLVSKLEETRQKLVNSDNKVRQLETQFCEAQHASATARNKVEELEHAMTGLRKEIEAEKQAAREEAWAKVSALELEVNAAMRDLDYERRRLKGARERIMLRETQLRAFYSTTEEISVLFAKQQEQLKAMQRTLEDEENYDNTSVDIDISVPNRTVKRITVRDKATACYHGNNTTKAGSNTSAQRVNFSGDEASATEKHDCDMRSQEVGENTQEAEFTSAERFVKGGFGSDIDGVGTEPVPERYLIGTERVLETESLGIEVERNIDLNRCETLGGDTMQCDYETNGNAPESNEQIHTTCPDTSVHSQSNKLFETQNSVEDTEAGGTIRTADLLASEVLGSWAQSTAPSVHGENESPKIGHNEEDRAMALHDSTGLVAESQRMPPAEAAAARRSDERQALTEMIGIVAPDLKEQFGVAANDDFDQQRKNLTVNSDSDTEDCVDSDDDNNKVAAISGSISDAETEGSDQAGEDQKHNEAMVEDDETSAEDSLG
ncbi:PREDICTED: CAP-Gly domain-containing linker protein 1 isoform X1 [Theobroma cacao]|uniref:CAP-Gly domain-containing linker protein 1 isoform X1 n=1 Tax=Theobroma cacao TaxID=3641 RepID=A0AB32VSY6_THECC|nr:PREDICTED: CAP-Gly domain-containing linker protein 1 isoform X1 [Theobroma cacao]